MHHNSSTIYDTSVESKYEQVLTPTLSVSVADSALMLSNSIYVVYAGLVFVVGMKMFDDHRHVLILG